MSKVIIRLLPCVLLALFLSGTGCQRGASEVERSLEQMEQVGVTEPSRELIARVLKSGYTVSDSDFDAVVHLLEERSVSNMDAAMLVATLYTAKNLSSDQISRMRKVALSMLSSPYPGDDTGEVTTRAIVFLEKHGDRSVIPALEALQKDPRETVRMTAETALGSLRSRL